MDAHPDRPAEGPADEPERTWPQAPRPQTPAVDPEAGYESVPARRRRGVPPRPDELNLEAPELRIVGRPFAEVRLSAATARRLAEAAYLGGIWGKSVMVRGPERALFLVPDTGFASVPMFPERHDLAVELRLGQLERLAAKLRAEKTDFRYPLWVHWIIESAPR